MAVVEKIIPLYKSLLAEEQKHTDRKVGMQTSFDSVVGRWNENGVDYDEFVATL